MYCCGAGGVVGAGVGGVGSAFAFLDVDEAGVGATAGGVEVWLFERLLLL